MKKPQFQNGYFYHVYNRGVEKRTIFLDDFDHFRFIHDTFEFNDTAPAGKFSTKQRSEVEPPNVHKREMLVKIHCFCLMPNHYHLLLEQVRDDGIVNFMKKMGTGYVMYFNEKYERVGPLFQGRFKALHVERDEYLLHLSRYIHLNPVELINKNWKDKGIKNWKLVNRFLETYRWSSYQDYVGKKSYPSLISKDFIYQVLGVKRHSAETEYRSFVQEWLAKDISEIADIALE